MEKMSLVYILLYLLVGNNRIGVQRLKHNLDFLMTFDLGHFWYLLGYLKILFFNFSILHLKVPPGRGRSDALTPSFRSGSSNASSSLMFTSIKRSGCSFRVCWTSPTDRWKSGSKTGEWKRKNWAEIVCNTFPVTLFCELCFFSHIYWKLK